jgi:hypothetical protein
MLWIEKELELNRLVLGIDFLNAAGGDELHIFGIVCGAECEQGGDRKAADQAQQKTCIHTHISLYT